MAEQPDAHNICASCAKELTGNEHVVRNQATFCFKCAKVEAVKEQPKPDPDLWKRVLFGMIVAWILIFILARVRPDWFNWASETTGNRLTIGLTSRKW